MFFLELLTNLLLVHLPAILRQIYIFLFDGAQAVRIYRHKFFAQLLQGFPDLHNAKVGGRKKKLFSQMNNLTSADQDLKKKKELRILEIGVGSGANLEYYPKKCHLVAVDPNQSFEQYFRENLTKFPGITMENFIVAPGEDMNQIKSESIDVVVTTLVTCSINNIDKVLAEIQRILVPGGRYYYMEHVMFDKSYWRYYLQNILNFTKIWPLLFDGCMFQPRDQMSSKCSQYFLTENEDKFYIDTSGLWVFKLCSPHVSGAVMKTK